MSFVVCCALQVGCATLLTMAHSQLSQDEILQHQFDEFVAAQTPKGPGRKDIVVDRSLDDTAVTEDDVEGKLRQELDGQSHERGSMGSFWTSLLALDLMCDEPEDEGAARNTRRVRWAMRRCAMGAAGANVLCDLVEWFPGMLAASRATSAFSSLTLKRRIAHAMRPTRKLHAPAQHLRGRQQTPVTGNVTSAHTREPIAVQGQGAVSGIPKDTFNGIPQFEFRSPMHPMGGGPTTTPVTGTGSSNSNNSKPRYFQPRRGQILLRAVVDDNRSMSSLAASFVAEALSVRNVATIDRLSTSVYSTVLYG